MSISPSFGALKPMMVFGVLYSDLVGPSQRHVDWREPVNWRVSIGSCWVLLEVFGIEFHEITEWQTRSLVGSYGISLQVK